MKDSALPPWMRWEIRRKHSASCTCSMIRLRWKQSSRRMSISGFRWTISRKTYVRPPGTNPVSYTHLRAHETVLDLVCRLLLEKKQKKTKKKQKIHYNSQINTYQRIAKTSTIRPKNYVTTLLYKPAHEHSMT